MIYGISFSRLLSMQLLSPQNNYICKTFSLELFFYIGSPKYFGPLLHFLRSGVFEIPPGVTHTALHKEAEFYGLTTVVAYFNQLEEDKKKKSIKKSELHVHVYTQLYVL